MTNIRSPSESALRAFLRSEAAGGMLIIVAAFVAMLIANSPWSDTYHHLIHHRTGPVLTSKLGPMNLHLWVNDGLMAVFFLLVGLEIKREFVDGRLSSWDQRRLPIIAAASGMAVPAILYLVVIDGDPALLDGWAIPAATDIAFALGVLALLGKRAPASLKLFLTTVAIADDLGAVAIIALVYTDALDSLALAAAGGILLLMYLIGKSGVRKLWPFLLLAALLWYAVLLSGVHATIAGVLAAFAIPILPTPGAPESAASPLHRLEHALSPVVAFAVVPLFALVNAGVALGGAVAAGLSSVATAIAIGLFFGKQIGILGSIWLCERLGLARRPGGASWLQIYGIALLCGVGFTMCLFISALAFADRPETVEAAKLGILLGSLASAVAGYLVLRLAPGRRPERTEDSPTPR